jgi:hypothetical protein
MNGDVTPTSEVQMDTNNGTVNDKKLHIMSGAAPSGQIRNHKMAEILVGRIHAHIPNNTRLTFLIIKYENSKYAMVDNYLLLANLFCMFQINK